MKKIINGKKYDTETARCVGSWENMEDCWNFDWHCEKLFLKTTGEFFIYTNGGRMDKPIIEPVLKNEAKAWAETYLPYDEYVATFGEVEE